MSRPIEEVDVICPKCRQQYQDWIRTPGFGDDFDDEYLDKCSSAMCSHCQHKVYFRDLSREQLTIIPWYARK